MALAVTTTSLPPAFPKVPYSFTLAATGGTPPYTWSISSGALPAGLTLAAATGVISGTPTGNTASLANVTFMVTDTVPATATQALTLAVKLVITLQCAVCGFYQKTTNPNIANLIIAKHQAGWLPRNAHVVSMS